MNCRYRVVESSCLVSVLFREDLAIPTSPFFIYLVNGFCVTSFRTFSMTPYLPYIDGRYRWAGRYLSGVSQHTISYGASQGPRFSPYKPMIKAHSS